MLVVTPPRAHAGPSAGDRVISSIGPHRFAVGQEVEATAGPLERNLPAGTHVITRALPDDNFDRIYRARNTQDGVDRVFREPQLRPGPTRPLG